LPRTADEGDAVEPPLPHSDESERSILGAILLDNGALTGAAQQLRSDDFSLPKHSRIFSAMVTLDVEGKPIDTVSLMEQLNRVGELEAAGGAAYLSKLADGLPPATNVWFYCEVVKDRSCRRKLIYESQALRERAFDLSEDVDETLGGAINRFGELRGYGTAKRSLPQIYTAPQLAALAPQPIDIVAYPLALRGMLAVLDGLAKTAGKTTLILYAILALLHSRPFLNRATKPVKVLLVSEENPRTLNLALDRVGLTGETDFHLLPRGEFAGMAWPTLAGYLEEKCAELKIGWLVIDTFYAIADLGADAENDAGVVDAAVAPLKTIAGRLDIPVTVSRHERKSGGQIGESGRGSTALSGAADVILRLQRMSANFGPNVRQLEITGRIEPEKLTIELTGDGTYIVHGEDARLSNRDEATAIGEAIAADAKATVRQLARDCGVGRNRVKRLAEQQGWLLTNSGCWERRP
jgi:DnaB-like helicase N terminal domain/AAA domain